MTDTSDTPTEAVLKAFETAAEQAKAFTARRERRVEDLLYGDIPTFMEYPLAAKPADLEGLDAAIVGFGYEGITIKTPSLSAPPTTARPPKDSIYWRMGADDAPDYIRQYSIFYSIHHNQGYYPEIDQSGPVLNDLKVADYGNVDVIRSDTEETMRRAYQKVADIVAAGAVPITLGGDHTIPTPVVKAVMAPREKPIGLVSFDGHMDLSYTPDLTWASNQWSKLMETGKLKPENLAIIGVRSNRSTVFETIAAKELGIRVFTIDEVKDRGMKAVIAEAISIATRGTDGLYVSIDIDAMEPTLVPGQKAPEIWGVTIDEIMIAMRALRQEDIIGFDICELSPDYDVKGMGAQFCARMVVEVLAGLGLKKRAGA
ncbi:MAG: arginase family protein [Pseudomonadota bacterium]